MSQLLITKKDETYLHITCDDSVARELFEYFSFFANGYKFMPLFQNKIWDGKIRLFNIQKRLIYKGLFHKIVEWAKDQGYTVTGSYQPIDNPITREEIEALYAKIGGAYTPKASQIEALYYALKWQNCMILSPTSSGKSFFLYNLMRVLKQTGRGLIIVPTINLVTQLKKDFIEYSVKNGWDVEKHVHQIYQGKDKVSPKTVYISTWQSLQTLGPKYFSSFDYVIVDEAHGAKAAAIKKIMESSTNAKFKIGTTGTLDGIEINELTIEGLFGRIKEVTTTHELIKSGDVANLTVNCIILQHTDQEEAKAVLKLDYQGQTQWLVQNEKRNKLIRKIVANEKGNKLVLFQFVEKHGIPLYKAFKKEYPDKDIFYISGKTPVEEREEIREKLKTTTDAILVASYGTYSTGMNVPTIHHVFSVTPGKSRVRILQSIGRVLRLSPGKKEAFTWDFSDEIRDGKKVNVGYKHFEERLEIYMKQKFKIKQYKVELK